MSKDIVIFGALLLDQYMMIDRWPQRSQDGFITEEQDFVGGCAINMAVTAQNLVRQEKEEIGVHVVSAMGTDRTSDLIMEYMEKHQLSKKFLFQSEGSTGRCLVFVEPDGERTFLTKEGMEGNFTDAMLTSIVEAGCKVAGVTGYYLLHKDSPKVVECLKRLKADGTKILFDPSPLVDHIPREIIDEMLTLADVITPNSTEMEALGGMEMIPGLQAMGKTIFYKTGPSGGMLFTEETQTVYRAKLVEAIDTTGAGDSFAGALLYAMAQDISMEDATSIAVECAAKTVQAFGPHVFWEN